MTFENADNIHNKKNESFEHRRSHDERMEEMPPRLRKQLELATELYEQIKDPTPDLEQTEINNRIMFLWSSTNEGTERSYSNIFAQIEQHPEFHGDIFEITIDDMDVYKESGKLPEHLRKSED